jgi:hypothetical protein
MRIVPRESFPGAARGSPRSLPPKEIAMEPRHSKAAAHAPRTRRAFSTVCAVVAAVVGLVAAPPHRARAADMMPDDPYIERHGGQTELLTPDNVRVRWGGGNRSLPYGANVTPDAVIARARSMPAVQGALDEFLGRGYVRRADLDYALSQVGYSVAVLGFQKPGFGVMDKQPFIQVVTRPYTIEGREYPTTQISGAVMADSADCIAPADPATDPAFFMIPVTPAQQNGAVPAPNDEDFVYKYSISEFDDELSRAEPHISPGMQKLIRAEAGTIIGNHVSAVVLSAGLSLPYCALAMVTAFGLSMYQIWSNPPDTCSCGPQPNMAAPDLVATRVDARGPLHALPGGRILRLRLDGSHALLGFDLPAAALVRAQVIDLQGRRVRDLGQTEFGNGAHVMAWDLRDESGVPVANGLYFVRLEAQTASGATREFAGRIAVTR